MGAVVFLVGGEGHGDEVILRGAEGAALLFNDADDGVGDAIGAELLADGVGAGEEVFLDVGADESDVRGVLLVGVGEVAAGGDVEVLHDWGIWEVRPRIWASVMEAVPCTSLPGDGLLGAHAVEAAGTVVADVLVVVKEQVFALGVLHVVVWIGGEGRGSGDGEGVGTVGGELGHDEEVGAVDEGDHGDDGRDANDDAEQREDTAELVGPEGLEGEF